MSPSSVEKILGNVDVDNMMDKSAWEKRQREMRKERSGRQSGEGFYTVSHWPICFDQSEAGILNLKISGIQSFDRKRKINNEWCNRACSRKRRR